MLNLLSVTEMRPLSSPAWRSADLCRSNSTADQVGTDGKDKRKVLDQYYSIQDCATLLAPAGRLSVQYLPSICLILQQLIRWICLHSHFWWSRWAKAKYVALYMKLCLFFLRHTRVLHRFFAATSAFCSIKRDFSAEDRKLLLLDVRNPFDHLLKTDGGEA